MVVAAIEPKLLEAEALLSQGRSPEDLGAWDMVIQANSLFWRLTTVERKAAIAILRQAVERYPDYAPAQSMLAFVLLISGYLGWALKESELQGGSRPCHAGGGTRPQRSVGAPCVGLCGVRAAAEHRGSGLVSKIS